jgi:hypothetical protein
MLFSNKNSVFLIVAGSLLLASHHSASAAPDPECVMESESECAVKTEQVGGTVSNHSFHSTELQTGGHAPVHTYRIGISQTLGAPETPFWLHANRDGRIPLYSRNNTLLSGEYHTMFLQNSVNWELDAGLQMDARISNDANMLNFTQLYAHLRTRGWQLSAGRFYDAMGLNSGYLTTGSMLMSRNALQPYKLRLSTPEFLPVPLTGGTISFKARWSEALLTDDRFVDRARVHQKYLYLKVQPVHELHLFAGIVHNLMWGGTHPEEGRLHTTFRAYISDVLAQPDDAASGNTTPKGNGLGGYDFGAEYRARAWTAGAWRLFYIEDGTAMNLRSPWDGIWGVWLDLHDPKHPRRFLNYITYEHINTKWQDGGGYRPIGRARFYTHRVWRDGWVHHGQTLGTPLILIDPSKAGTEEQLLVNNMILGHHLGMAGRLTESVSWEMLATYSRNYGICRDQTSGGGCGGSADEPVWERDDYVPYHTLRRDRYSFLMKVSFPIFSSFQPFAYTGRSAGQTGVQRAGYESRLGERTGNPIRSSADPPVFGRTPPRPGPGMHMILSAALDAGAFHDRPLYGVEIGVSVTW